MKKSLRSLCAITTISLCAMGNLFAVDNNYFNSVYIISVPLKLGRIKN